MPMPLTPIISNSPQRGVLSMQTSGYAPDATHPTGNGSSPVPPIEGKSGLDFGVVSVDGGYSTMATG